MRGYNKQHTSIFVFCFAFFANVHILKSQAVPWNWIQFQEQPHELVNILRHAKTSGFEMGLTSQKIVTGTDLNAFDFSCLYHNKHTYGLNLMYFGSPDFQTTHTSLGYLWQHPKFDVALSTQWQKSTLSSWSFVPGASVSYRNTKNSRFSAYFQHNNSMGLGYHIRLKQGGMLNVNYMVPSFSISENTHLLSCSFYYPASDQFWLGIESHPQRRFNQLTLLYRVSDRINAAIQSGYFSSFQTFNLSFYAGLSLP